MIKTDARFQEEYRRFYNANVFQAYWMTQIGQGGPQREWGSAVYYALWHLSCALDVGIAPTALGLRRTELWIPQAAQWILIAGSVIHRLCLEEEFNTGEPAVPRAQGDVAVDGFLFSGQEGFSVRRWDFWKQRFSAIAAMDATSQVAQLAGQAAARMAEIERAGTGDA